jgi:glycine cleavage system H protein
MFELTIVWLATLAVVLIGLVARALLAVLIIGAILVPLALLVLAWAWAGRLGDRLAGLQRVGHVVWRSGCFYTPGHLWLRPRHADTVRIGLDDVAHRVLPDIGAIRLALAGTSLEEGEPLGEIHCPSGVVTLRAPVTGTVAAVNARLERDPALLHADPYRRAWLVEMAPCDDAFRLLPSGEKARRWLAGEDARLTDFFEQQLGIAAADGGELIVPPHTLLTPEQWQAARAAFLQGELAR